MMSKPVSHRSATAGVVSTMGLCALLFVGGCGERSASAEALPPPVKSDPPQLVAMATAQPDTAMRQPAAIQASVPKTAGKGGVVDEGGLVEVKATKEGLTRIGAAKCKTCHVVQFKSWSEGAHAKRTPPLDCESCHGAGSEYKALAVMKDPAKARAAGLVMPGREFCATCHRSGWTDDMLTRAHAHKAAAGGK
jgi:hypothetical protein